MRYRKLRIAFSATCLIACVLLIALWVRSYSWIDNSLVLTNPAIVSLRGKLLVATRLEVVYGPDDTSTHFDHRNWLIHGYSHRLSDIKVENVNAKATLPIWIPTALFATFGAAAWFRWHFSLRTLLIATTLIAAVLGIAVWAAGK
jgi:hypothetical protein